MKNCKVCNSECNGIGFGGIMTNGVCFRCALAEYGELKAEVEQLRENHLKDLWQHIEYCYPKHNGPGWLVTDQTRRTVSDFLRSFEAAEANGFDDA